MTTPAREQQRRSTHVNHLKAPTGGRRSLPTRGHIRRRVAELRELGWTQRALADVVGCSETVLSNWLRLGPAQQQVRHPGVSRLWRITSEPTAMTTVLADEDTAARARQVLRTLREADVPWFVIARHTGVTVDTMRSWLNHTDRTPRREAAELVGAVDVDRIISDTRRPPLEEQRSYLQRLLADGWTRRDIARHVGVDPTLIAGVLAKRGSGLALDAWQRAQKLEGISAPRTVPLSVNGREVAELIADIRQAGWTLKRLRDHFGLTESVFDPRRRQTRTSILAVYVVHERRHDLTCRVPDDANPTTVLPQVYANGWSDRDLDRIAGIQRGRLLPGTRGARQLFLLLTWLTDHTPSDVARLLPQSSAVTTRSDATQAAERIHALREQGWSWHAIAIAAGVNRTTVQRIATGTNQRVKPHTMERILQVQGEPSHGTTMPDAAEVRTHVEELIAAGWTKGAISRAAQRVEVSTISTLLNDSTALITHGTAARLLAVQGPAPRPPLVPSVEVARHIDMLIAAGGMDRTIAEIAGVATTVVTKVRVGRQTTVRADIADYILAVTPDMVPDERPITAGEVQQHIAALFAAVPHATVTGLEEASGVANRTIVRVRRAHPEQQVRYKAARKLLNVTKQDLTRHSPQYDDPMSAQEILIRHLDEGASLSAIAAQVGVSLPTLTRIRDGQALTAPLGLANALTAFTMNDDTYRKALVPALGARRRMRALSAAGWSRSDLMKHLPPYAESLLVTGTTAGDRHLRPTDDAVKQLYERLRDQPGPSRSAATMAARRGWLAPQWWDDDLLDDPNAWPSEPEHIHFARLITLKQLTTRYPNVTVAELAVWTAVPEALIASDLMGAARVKARRFYPPASGYRPVTPLYPQAAARLWSNEALLRYGIRVTTTKQWPNRIIANAADIPISTVNRIAQDTKRPTT